MTNVCQFLTAFLLFGVAALLPWNAFITANEYFMWKFRDVSAYTNGSNYTHFSPLQELFENLFAIFGSTMNLAGVLLNMGLTYKLSAFIRMCIGHFLAVFGLIITAVFTHVSTDSWQLEFFVLTMALLIVATIGSSFIQGSASGLAAQQSTSHSMKFLMTGQAVVGVLVSCADLTTLAVGESIEISSVLYFSFSAALVLISFSLYWCITRKDPRMAGQRKPSVQSNGTEDLNDEDERKSLINSVERDLLDAEKATNPLKSICNWNVLRSTFPYGFCLMMTFAITLSCFPAVVSKVKTSDPLNRSWSKYFTSFGVFLTFNAGDLLGRTTTFVYSWPKFNRRPWMLLALNVLRIGFIPALLFCNIQPRLYTTPIFTHDYEFILILAFLAWTNGYLVNVAVGQLPKTVEQSETELAGALVSVYCLVGIAIGPILSLLLWKVI